MSFRVVRCPLLLSALVLGGCGAAETHSRPNLLLVTIDTLRADRCSSYGHDRNTTPRLDRLAEDGVRFAVAYAPTPVTGPSHASLLTSQHPQQHGVLRNGDALSGQAVTLAEVLQDAGYDTAAIVSAYPLKAKFGLAQGFRVYEDDFRAPDASLPQPRWEGRPLGESYDRRAWATSDLALAWLARQAASQRPFFLWIHYFDPHSPYDAPAAEEDLTAFDAYDREIRYTDGEMGRVLDFIDAAGLRATTVVAVTSDHGEGLGQHGHEEHGAVVYEEAVRIPLVLRGPGRLAGGRVWTDEVTLLDVAPTLLGVLRLATRPKAFVGRDLSGPLEGRPGRVPQADAVFLRSELRPAGCQQYAVRQGQWKYLEDRCQGTLRRSELYDLQSDPGELQDLSGAKPEQVPAAARLLRQWRRTRGAPGAPPSPEDAEALRALGYF
jgi:arylsulfatase A-like enzyme